MTLTLEATSRTRRSFRLLVLPVGLVIAVACESGTQVESTPVLRGGTTCPWAPTSTGDPSVPSPPTWQSLSLARARDALTRHGQLPLAGLHAIEGCALPVFMSNAVVVRFRSSSPLALDSWTGTPAPEHAKEQLPWLRENLPGLALEKTIEPLRFDIREADGNVDERGLYRASADGEASYLFVFMHAG